MNRAEFQSCNYNVNPTICMIACMYNCIYILSAICRKYIILNNFQMKNEVKTEKNFKLHNEKKIC